MQDATCRDCGYLVMAPGHQIACAERPRPAKPPTVTDPEAIRRGATIRALREAYGLKAHQLGKLIGKSEDLITAIERGERRATPEVCRAIADKLNIPVAAITVEDYPQIAGTP